MEEIEITTEHLHEQIKEKAEALKGNHGGKSSMYIAICTALMAVFAAIAGLLAGHYSNEALIGQIKASDQWAFYQAKSIKVAIKKLEPFVAGSAQKTPEQIQNEEDEIKKKAQEFEKESAIDLEKHSWLAKAVTFFQVAIAISAISLLSGKTMLWYIGILLALIGSGFFITGLV